MAKDISTTCVIAGGGPAGMMCGYLLARAGIDVHVLEKHKDFLRDFRGDTIHPSTLDVMDQLGLGDAFDALPHSKVFEIGALVGDRQVTVADFRKLRRKRDYIAFLPQWDFLDFLAGHGRAYPGFHLHMETEATGLIEEDGEVKGVRARGPLGEMAFHAPLTIACDGRGSTLREQSGLAVTDFGAPMDVLWFHLQKPEGHGEEPPGRFLPGKIFVMIDRGTYWQCGYVIPKGHAEELKAKPFADFIERLGQDAPSIAGALQTLSGWDDFKLLSVQVNRLEKWWRPGFLCIGDAAHAMSPIGGIGINIAIQDAVATANLLTGPLRFGELQDHQLQAVQMRRLGPAKMTQSFQLAVQKQIIAAVLEGDKPFKAPLPLRLFNIFPFLQAIPARFIGLGLRPERVDSALLD